jgi:DNA-binding SARP family transcriptional activator
MDYLETSRCQGLQPGFVPRQKRTFSKEFLLHHRADRGKILCVISPFGSGKTDFAISFARELYTFKRTYWFDASSASFSVAYRQGKLENFLIMESERYAEPTCLLVIDNLPAVNVGEMKERLALFDRLLACGYEILLLCSSLAGVMVARTLSLYPIKSVHVVSGNKLMSRPCTGDILHKNLRAFYDSDYPASVVQLGSLVLLFAKGSFENISDKLGIKITPEDIIFIENFFPFFGVDSKEKTFSMPKVDPEKYFDELYITLVQEAYVHFGKKIALRTAIVERCAEYYDYALHAGETMRAVDVERFGRRMRNQFPVDSIQRDSEVMSHDKHLALSQEKKPLEKPVRAVRSGRVVSATTNPDTGAAPGDFNDERSLADECLAESDETDSASTLKGEGDGKTEHADTALGLEDCPKLSINLLGGFSVSIADRVIDNTLWQRQKAKMLLVHLVLATGHELSREHIMNLLWPDLEEAKARSCLYVTCGELRKILRHEYYPCFPYIQNLGNLYSINKLLVISDVARFEQLTRNLTFGDMQEESVVSICCELEEIYRGDLLAGQKCDRHVEAVRIRYKNMYTEALVTGVYRLLKLRELHKAFWFAQRVMEQSGMSEESLCALMCAHAALGQRGAAIETYVKLKDLLAEEYGINPSSTTTRLFEHIVNEDDFLSVIDLRSVG